jgi:hypothetical protein
VAFLAIINVIKRIQGLIRKSRLLAILYGVIISITVDIIFSLAFPEKYLLSDFIVCLLTGITIGLFTFELLKTSKK